LFVQACAYAMSHACLSIKENLNYMQILIYGVVDRSTCILLAWIMFCLPRQVDVLLIFIPLQIVFYHISLHRYLSLSMNFLLITSLFYDTQSSLIILLCYYMIDHSVDYPLTILMHHDYSFWLSCSWRETHYSFILIGIT
jgi:hypothetical protein